MPGGRPRNNAKRLKAAVDELAKAIDGLVGKLGSASQRATQPDATPRKAGKRGPGRGNRKLKAALKSVWANYTPAQRAARIAAMKAGHAKRKRRLGKDAAPKPARKAPKQAASKQVARKRPAPTKPSPAPRKSAWAAMTPEQRAARVAKMQAGRAKAVGATPAAAPAAAPAV